MNHKGTKDTKEYYSVVFPLCVALAALRLCGSFNFKIKPSAIRTEGCLDGLLLADLIANGA